MAVSRSRLILGVKPVDWLARSPYRREALELPLDRKAIELLRAADHPAVNLLIDGQPAIELTPRQAIARLEHGGYDVKTRKKRVRWIRVAGKPAHWEPCWRTTKASTLWETSWGEMETQQ